MHFVSFFCCFELLFHVAQYWSAKTSPEPSYLYRSSAVVVSTPTPDTGAAVSEPVDADVDDFLGLTEEGRMGILDLLLVDVLLDDVFKLLTLFCRNVSNEYSS